MPDDVAGSDWTDAQVDLIVADYFDMHGMWLRGKPFTKAYRSAALQALKARLETCSGLILRSHFDRNGVLKDDSKGFAASFETRLSALLRMRPRVPNGLSRSVPPVAPRRKARYDEPMSSEPESLVLPLLRAMRDDMQTMRGDMATMRADMATKSDVAELRSEMHALRADVASDLLDLRKEMTGMRKDLGDQIVGLRRAVVEYHTSVIGHGIIIRELEARVRRVEQHLDLPPIDAH